MRIFLPQDTDFSSNGEKSVNPISCVEHREISDWYIECKFTLDDVDLIKQDYILIVETKEKNNQPFRIHNIEVGNTIYCKAYHVGYDTKHYAVQLSTVLNGNCNACLVELKKNIEPLSTPFKFSSNINLLRSFSVINVSLYEALGQIASEYAGTLDFDGWNVYILDSIGKDRGISIEYGKNLESATVTEDWENVVTKLKPIGNNGITLTPEWLTADISYAKPYTKIMTFNTDTVENLGLVAQLYLDRYKYPKINYAVRSTLSQNGIAQITVNKHGQLVAYTHSQLAEFSHAQIASTSNSLYFGLGDTIVVKARQFEVTTDVISYDYNCLTKYVIGIEFGNYRPTVKNFFNELKSTIEDSTSKRVQVKIDQLKGDFTIVANNYNNGLLQGTYYNFDGDAFTITNSLNKTVFSADSLGNLTLTGTITGSTIIGSILKTSENNDRIEINNNTIQAYLNNVSRVKLDYESLKFYDSNAKLSATLEATTTYFEMSTIGSTSVNQYAVLSLSDTNPVGNEQAGYGLYAYLGTQKVGTQGWTYADGRDPVTILISETNGTERSYVWLENARVDLYSTTQTYRIFYGGSYKTLSIDANGFVKAS